MPLKFMWRESMRIVYYAILQGSQLLQWRHWRQTNGRLVEPTPNVISSNNITFELLLMASLSHDRITKINVNWILTRFRIMIWFEVRMFEVAIDGFCDSVLMFSLRFLGELLQSKWYSNIDTTTFVKYRQLSEGSLGLDYNNYTNRLLM